MNARSWQRRSDHPLESWLLPLGRTFLGIALLTAAIYAFPTVPPLVRGWMGMVAIASAAAANAKPEKIYIAMQQKRRHFAA